jgi:hypothetical protein
MMLLSHIGDDAIESTWSRRDGDAEVTLAVAQYRCRGLLAM